ncbi:hypothetical protein [Winogradskyella sediminis]|uniref:Uncharacterized protein n=1 Tax=Winogradskyella sediminis TaxID=1382466 RepID=A0A1H1S8F2_9FLAO|nr:hypothetical protein [Winogradskyella sediminis]SDS44173.1 hypothetical protein SAMN04489797_1609 [Winogradskyella sediminis]
MKLTKEDIQFIDDFLKNKKIKHLDIRVELIDHLATEFEECSAYVFIEDFLLSKVDFILEFDKKQKKAIHWSYQRLLWVQFAKFFYQLKFIGILIVLAIIGYTAFNVFSLKTFSFFWLTIQAILMLYPIYYQMRYSKTLKKVQSVQSLFTITSLPSVFLYTFGVLKDYLFETPMVLVLYFSVSILLSLSAVIVIENNRRKIIEKYTQLVNEL